MVVLRLLRYRKGIVKDDWVTWHGRYREVSVPCEVVNFSLFEISQPEPVSEARPGLSAG